MGQVGERLWVLLHEPEGPLVAYLDAFASHLDAQGFKRHLLGRQIRQAAKFSRWLQSARVAASAVTEEHVQRFLWETAQRRPVRQGTAATLRRLIDEKIFAKTMPYDGRPLVYKADDTLLTFLRSLRLGQAMPSVTARNGRPALDRQMSGPMLSPQLGIVWYSG